MLADSSRTSAPFWLVPLTNDCVRGDAAAVQCYDNLN